MASKSQKYIIGSKVQWKWMGKYIVGSVKEIYTEPITREIKGKSIKRNGSVEIPAYLVESEAGNLALKLETEIQPFEKAKVDPRKPKMFS